MSTMVASALNNTNLFENNTDVFKYNSIYNQQLYTDSLAKLITYLKPTELLQRTSNSSSLMYQTHHNTFRYHPYFKMCNNNQSSVDFCNSQSSTQNNHLIQHVILSNINKNNFNNTNINSSVKIFESMNFQNFPTLKSPKQE